MPPGTFDDYMNSYLNPVEEPPLFTPISGPQQDYSTALESLYPATENLYTPISLSLTPPEPEGTFATSEFDLDYTNDPLTKLINEQIKESSSLSDSYSSQLSEISDRQQSLTNSAENDWSSIGAALFGGIGAALAGGNMGDIAGGAAAIGTAHYNNLEAQEKTKQALLDKEANRLLTEQKIEQSRLGQLRNTQAQATARMQSLKEQGKVIGDPNFQKRIDAETRAKIDTYAARPKNDAYIDQTYVTAIKPVLQNISETPGLKPLPGDGTAGSVPASTYYNQRKTGVPMSKMESGYTAYLDGLSRARQEAQKGSQMNINVYREAIQSMSRGAKDLAEIGQAVTASEFERYVAPLLPQNEKLDIFSPHFNLYSYLDSKVNDRNLPDMLNVFEKGMAAQRAKFFLAQGRVVPNYDYSQLSPTSLGTWRVEDLNRQSVSGPTFAQMTPIWFPDNPIDAKAIDTPAPTSAPVSTPAAPPNGMTDEQKRARLAELEAKHGKGR